MSTSTSALDEIQAAPEGPEIAAFFDLDRTLLAGFSASSFLSERLLKGQMSPQEVLVQLSAVLNYGAGRKGFSSLLSSTTRMLQGSSEQLMLELGETVFEKKLSGAIYPEARALVNAHLEKGHTVAIVSSATQYQIGAVARDLGIEHVMCTELAVEDDTFTGEIIRPVCWGEGKLTHAQRFTEKHQINLQESYFYTDSMEDLPLLEGVGNPRPINPDEKLDDHAREHNWPVEKFASRPKTGVKDVVRTGLVYGSMLGSTLAALAVGLMGASKREVANLTFSTWGDFSCAIAGLDLEVKGEEHLWSHRPCVFILNHQSGLDAMIGAKLMRRDMTSIMKKELKKTPLVGQFLTAAGVVFIDRADKAQALEAMEPAVQALRDGISIGLAPEGTRSPTNKLGAFKKGAFHMAMQGGVAIVPIVIHDAYLAMPKNTWVIRPATIHVEVLPPISTDSWKVETIDSHIAEVRELFFKTLGQQDDETV